MNDLTHATIKELFLQQIIDLTKITIISNAKRNDRFRGATRDTPMSLADILNEVEVDFIK